jgi:DNA-binding response OmpR family regulator
MERAELLVVEDDLVIGAELRTALTSSGFAVTWVQTGAEAVLAMAGRRPDLVLLDLGLPDIDGVALSRRLRELAPDTVIVVLTARTAEFEVIVALDAGVDDYLTKPFRLAELLARLRAHLRRRSVRVGAADQLRVGRLELDVAARRLSIDGREVVLRPKEFDLLAILVGRAGHAVSREELMAGVWDENWFGSTKTLDVHVSTLRRKLGEVGSQADRITTLRGHGYRYELDPAPASGG